jgi:hypothetical protein
VTVAAVCAVVAAVIPTHAVADRNVSIVGNGLPVRPDRAAGFPLVVAGRHVTVTPPAGYFVIQVRSGDAGAAHVTLAPSQGPGDQMVVRFAAPAGIRLGAIVGVHQGTPVRETRFGTLWRSNLGVVVLVTGSSPVAQLAAIDGVRVTE